MRRLDRRVRIVRRGAGVLLCLLGLAAFLWVERLGLTSVLMQNVIMGTGFVAAVAGLLIWNGDAMRRYLDVKYRDRREEQDE